MKKILSFLSSLIIVLLTAYTIHDMQSSQGVGYYFCLKFGADSRLVFDIIADFVFLAILALLIVLPVHLRKIKRPDCFGRFLILFIAIMPTIRTDYLLSMTSEADRLSTMSFSARIASLLSVFQLMAILYPLAIGYFSAIKGNQIRKNFFVLPSLAVIISLLALLFPLLLEGLLFIACYLLLLSFFDILEKSDFSNIYFYSFFFLTAIYKLLFVSASWSI